MITMKHVEIYTKYSKGLDDMFILSGTPEEKSIMDYKHWSLISSLVQDLSMIKQGLAADSYIKMAEEKLKENCDSEETIQALKQIV